MGARNYAYQYETSPRKIKPEYDTPPKKKVPARNSNTKKNVNKKSAQTKQRNTLNKAKAREAKIARVNFSIVAIVVLVCILFMMYRNVKINESFNQIQVLTKTVSNIEKENSQLAVNIQNSLNLSNIESIAASTLGMQKLSNKQTVYVTLDAKDYVEVSSPKIQKKEKGFFEKIIDNISNWF